MKLRTIAAVVLVGLVLAVSGLAHAVDPPPFTGTFYAHMDNYDASRVYTGKLADGVTPVTPGVVYAPAALQYLQPTNADNPLETSWGVFRFQQVLEGEVTGPNTITKVAPPNVIWTEGNDNRELVGVFYDRHDLEVTFSNVGHIDGDAVLPPEALYYQLIKSNNTKYKLWYQPFGNYDNGMGGPDARLGIDDYPTIGDVAGFTTRVVEGVDADDIFTTFDPAMYVPNLIGNPIVLPSTTNTYIKLTAGPWMNPGNGVWFDEAFPLGGALTPDAHLSLNSTLKPTNKPNDTNPLLTAWDIASSDPITGHVEVIPEPVTMFGVLAGIGGLFGYIRKRRK